MTGTNAPPARKRRWARRAAWAGIAAATVVLGLFVAVELLLPLRPDPPGIDLMNVPGAWENHTVVLPGRGDGGGPLRVHYLAAGPSGAPVVVLLHGFPDTAFGWRHVIPLLSSDFRVLAPELRGYAGTDRPLAGYDLGWLAGDLEAFIDETHAVEHRPRGAPVHLIAHDWGALVTWRATTDAPERFTTATILDIPHPLAFADQLRASAKQREYRWFVAQLVSPGAARLLAGLSVPQRSQIFYLDELHRASALTEADGLYYQAVFNRPEKLRGPLEYYQELAAHGDQITEHFAGAGPVKVPTLVLWGALDSKMMSEMAAMSCTHVSARCEHEVFAESGHYLQWELPDAVVARWRRFVDVPPPVLPSDQSPR